MAIVEREPIAEATLVETPAPSAAALRRPRATTGAWSWFTTIDHKKIGILYGATAFVFFIVGGLEALLIRLQLARPNGHVLSAEAYNQIFTMHGLTMIFLVVMPLSNGFANYIIPLQIGARDVAFPRLNAFGYWAFVIGGLFLYSSFLDRKSTRLNSSHLSISYALFFLQKNKENERVTRRGSCSPVRDLMRVPAT